MTVSTIANVASALTRAQESQNKQASTRVREPEAQVPASDTVAVSSGGLNRDEATAATETQNRDAATSVLNEADFDAMPQTSPQERVQAQAKEALQAQTTRLPANILALISE